MKTAAKTVMRRWALRDAKAHLRKVVRLVSAHEPQEITLRGEPTVVVLSRQNYDRLTSGAESLVDFMRRSPLYGDEDIEFVRDNSLARVVAL